MLTNDVKLMGRVREIEEKTYPDGVKITYFLLDFDRATRVDTFTCRIFDRINSRPFLGTVAEGGVVQVSGQLTTAGTSGRRLCVDVCHWLRIPEDVI